MKSSMKKIILAVVMVVVVAAGLLVYSSDKKTAAPTVGEDGSVSGAFTGTAKGFGGDVNVTLTLTDGKITDCTAEGKDETQGVGSMAIDQLPGAIAESGSIAVDGATSTTSTPRARP